MLSKAGAAALRATDPNELENKWFNNPGVGSFDPAMIKIREVGFDGAIQN